MPPLSLKDLSLNGKKVLMRVDFNVPLNSTGTITDDTRIKASLPTIRYILSKGASLILMSHLGRPKGKKNEAFSLKKCAEHLSTLLNMPVLFSTDCVGPQTTSLVNQLNPGQVLLLENLRFYEAEEHPEKDPEFAKQLASYGDIYVNDAFGTAHRTHSSTFNVPKLFPNKAVAGLLMQKEIEYLQQIFQHPKKPFYVVLGGAKISDKCGVIESMMKRCDYILIGGGMAYTFLKAQGIAIGNSIHEDAFLEKARQLLNTSGTSGNARLLLPLDLIVATSLSEEAKTLTIQCDPGIPQGYEGVDIGPKTITYYTEELKKAKTIFWNGPVGVFENPLFATGTNSLARSISNTSALTVIGGGDSIAAIQRLKIGDKFTHLSTGGGASLEYLELGTLPGLNVLSNSP